MIRIIADTTCGLPLEQLSNLGIDTLPQFITFGEVAYRDDTEIDTPTFIKKLRASSKLPHRRERWGAYRRQRDPFVQTARAVGFCRDQSARRRAGTVR